MVSVMCKFLHAERVWQREFRHLSRTCTYASPILSRMCMYSSSTKKQKLESGGVKGFDGETHEYLNYTEASKNYDKTRAPLGLNIILGTYAMHSLPISQQDLLDVGCGTGTFLQAVKGRFKSVTGVEYNEGMLAQARTRHGDSVKLVQGAGNSLPFGDASFDALVMNQVAHHFPSDNNYEYLLKTLKECFRVLRPGGSIVINTSSPEQQRDCFWWVVLFGKSQRAIMDRFPPLDVVEKHMLAAGFSVTEDSYSVPVRRSLMKPEEYLKGGIAAGLRSDYRDGDSSWGMAENMGELKGVLEKIEGMIAEGSDKEFEAQREAIRTIVGQATMVSGVKA